MAWSMNGKVSESIKFEIDYLTVPTAIEELTACFNQIPEKYRDEAKIDLDYGDGWLDCSIRYTRDATPDELAEEAERRAANLKRSEAELHRLAASLGKKVLDN